MTYLASLIYAGALLLANLSIAHFGPASAPINAFLFIGLDLTLRDKLHARLSPRAMLALISLSAVLTFLLNPAAGAIALASAVAFLAASLADWAAFAALRGRRWLLRSNASNVAGAAVDSIVFPLLAFGGLAPSIVVSMFSAKVAGGTLWAWALRGRK